MESVISAWQETGEVSGAPGDLWACTNSSTVENFQCRLLLIGVLVLARVQHADLST
jgi:hypothetical protein